MPEMTAPTNQLPRKPQPRVRVGIEKAQREFRVSLMATTESGSVAGDFRESRAVVGPGLAIESAVPCAPAAWPVASSGRAFRSIAAAAMDRATSVGTPALRPERP